MSAKTKSRSADDGASLLSLRATVILFVALVLGGCAGLLAGVLAFVQAGAVVAIAAAVASGGAAALSAALALNRLVATGD